MKTKISITLLSILLILFILLGVLYFYVGRHQEVGSQRDEYGCLGSAGYSWNEELDICKRGWEFKGESEINASKIAINNLKKSRDVKGLTLVQIDLLRCEGCFVVYFDQYQEKIRVDIIDWEIIE